MKPVRATAGYALLELLVVIAIIAVVATAALPYAFGSIERLSLESDARRVAGELRRLRGIAMDQQKDIVLTVPAEGRGLIMTSVDREIRLSPGISATIEPAAPQGGVIVGWDGSVAGSLVLAGGARRLRLAQRAPAAPLAIEPLP